MVTAWRAAAENGPAIAITTEGTAPDLAKAKDLAAPIRQSKPNAQSRLLGPRADLRGRDVRLMAQHISMRLEGRPHSATRLRAAPLRLVLFHRISTVRSAASRDC
jgi:hypothetical protein